MKRSVLGGIALWCVVAAAASTVAWVAINQVGQDVASTPPVALPSSTVTTSTATPSVPPSPSSSPGSTGTPRPTGVTSAVPTRSPAVTPVPPPVSSAPATVTLTWSGSAGTVRASCTGSTPRLVSATPADGWRVERDDDGGSEVKVKFERDESEVEVRASCVNGRPVFRVENKD